MPPCTQGICPALLMPFLQATAFWQKKTLDIYAFWCVKFLSVNQGQTGPGGRYDVSYKGRTEPLIIVNASLGSSASMAWRGSSVNCAVCVCLCWSCYSISHSQSQWCECRVLKRTIIFSPASMWPRQSLLCLRQQSHPNSTPWCEHTQSPVLEVWKVSVQQATNWKTHTLKAAKWVNPDTHTHTPPEQGCL